MGLIAAAARPWAVELIIMGGCGTPPVGESAPCPNANRRAAYRFNDSVGPGLAARSSFRDMMRLKRHVGQYDGPRLAQRMHPIYGY